jgi:hypothetical protein
MKQARSVLEFDPIDSPSILIMHYVLDFTVGEHPAFSEKDKVR